MLLQIKKGDKLGRGGKTRAFSLIVSKQLGFTYCTVLLQSDGVQHAVCVSWGRVKYEPPNNISTELKNALNLGKKIFISFLYQQNTGFSTPLLILEP